MENKQKKTIGEMEQEFLRALHSFYYNQKAIMSNEEFDDLKEELMWEGSGVVMLSADEQRLLEALMAYIGGNPVMSDAEFDELKLRLKETKMFVELWCSPELLGLWLLQRCCSCVHVDVVEFRGGLLPRM